MNWGGTRTAIQVALAWGQMQKSEMGMIGWMKYLAKIDRSSKLDANELIVDGLEVGEILRAVSEQRPAVRAWLEYAYGPDRPDLMRAELAFNIAFKLFGTLGGKRFQRHRKLCEAAVLDYAVRVTSEHKYGEIPRAVPPERYIKIMGLKANPKKFEMEWGRKRDLAIRQLIKLDAEGVGCVSSTVRCLSEGLSMIEEGVKKPDLPSESRT